MRKALTVALGFVAGAVAMDAFFRRGESVAGRLLFGRPRQSADEAGVQDPGPPRGDTDETDAALHEGCREEVLAVARLLHAEGREDFSPADVVDAMRAAGTRYAESTIRTHVVSRMCADAPDNHGTTYDDLERVGRGRYRLRGQ